MSDLLPGLALALGTVSPSVLTTAFRSPDRAVAFAATVLTAILARMTTNLGRSNATPTDTALEAVAVGKTMITDDANRATRIALGSVNLLAALVFAYRRAEARRSSSTLKDDGSAAASSSQPTKAILVMLAESAVTFVLLYLACIWSISGYYGQ